MRHPRLVVRILRLIACTCTFVASGCVTRGYKLADKDTPPSVPLNLTSMPGRDTATTSPPAQVVVHTAIIYRGPGSWKREAYWDEYVLTVTNRGEQPLTVTSATLHANNGESSQPGDNPWKLEKIGRNWWHSNAGDQARTYLLLGGGAVAGAGVALASALSAGFWAPLTGAAAVGATVGTATFLALPVVALGSVGMNIHRKRQVEAEFARRRLMLPQSIAPGESRQGSLFFRITPSPRELVVHAASAGETRDIRVDLAPLAGLHMRMPIQPPKP